jgi:hypothetical protein
MDKMTGLYDTNKLELDKQAIQRASVRAASPEGEEYIKASEAQYTQALSTVPTDDEGNINYALAQDVARQTAITYAGDSNVTAIQENYKAYQADMAAKNALISQGLQVVSSTDEEFSDFNKDGTTNRYVNRYEGQRDYIKAGTDIVNLIKPSLDQFVEGELTEEGKQSGRYAVIGTKIVDGAAYRKKAIESALQSGALQQLVDDKGMPALERLMDALLGMVSYKEYTEQIGGSLIQEKTAKETKAEEADATIDSMQGITIDGGAVAQNVTKEEKIKIDEEDKKLEELVLLDKDVVSEAQSVTVSGQSAMITGKSKEERLEESRKRLKRSKTSSGIKTLGNTLTLGFEEAFAKNPNRQFSEDDDPIEEQYWNLRNSKSKKGTGKKMTNSEVVAEIGFAKYKEGKNAVSDGLKYRQENYLSFTNNARLMDAFKNSTEVDGIYGGTTGFITLNEGESKKDTKNLLGKAAELFNNGDESNVVITGKRPTGRVLLNSEIMDEGGRATGAMEVIITAKIGDVEREFKIGVPSSNLQKNFTNGNTFANAFKATTKAEHINSEINRIKLNKDNNESGFDIKTHKKIVLTGQPKNNEQTVQMNISAAELFGDRYSDVVEHFRAKNYKDGDIQNLLNEGLRYMPVTTVDTKSGQNSNYLVPVFTGMVDGKRGILANQTVAIFSELFGLKTQKDFMRPKAAGNKGLLAQIAGFQELWVTQDSVNRFDGTKYYNSTVKNNTTTVDERDKPMKYSPLLRLPSKLAQ